VAEGKRFGAGVGRARERFEAGTIRDCSIWQINFLKRLFSSFDMSRSRIEETYAKF
jgi:hypothetical protein